MVIKQNIPLSELTTMRMGGNASVVVTVTSTDEMIGALQQVKISGLPWRVLGWGSNVIARDDGFAGVIIVNKISGFTVLEQTMDGALISAGAGESLDTVVARTVEMGLSGIEALSAIPGTLGAAPVQNAGAYGQEIGDTVRSLTAIDTTTLDVVTLTKENCAFAYRDSIFKHNDRRYVITSVTLALVRKSPEPPFYASLQRYFETHDVTDFSPAAVRAAVTEIRKEKLPSPMLIPNAGSFFKNPVVTAAVRDAVLHTHAHAPSFASGDGFKIPAGWLIEQAGLKGYAHSGLRTYAKNALVVTNPSGADYANLSTFRAHIIATVEEAFGVTLEQEPEEI